MKCKRILTIIVSLILILPSGVFADEPQVMKFTLQDCVKKGIENSIALKQVMCQVELNGITKEKAYFNDNSLNSGAHDLGMAASQINQASADLADKEKQLKIAQGAVNNGIVPSDITLPSGDVIKAGTAISSLPSDAVNSINDMFFNQYPAQIEEGKQQLAKAEEKFSYAQAGFADIVSQASASIGSKIGANSVRSYSSKSTGQLMKTMADVSFLITVNSYNIYKNQIAMLIQNNYYECLKAKAIVDVKQKAMERGEKQSKFSTDGFEAGLKSKDDMLLAGTYYDSTVIEYIKAVGDFNNTLYELKKSMNIPLDTQLELLGVMVDTVETQNLKDGLLLGLEKRLEMQKAAGEVIVYDANFEASSRCVLPNTFQYKEAEILKNQARNQFEITKQEVTASIYKSYETLKTTAEMLERSKPMLDKANETLEIANYKYQEGFGSDNSLLQKLNLESASGTIIEVLAAEENLIAIQEKIIEITYGYNLAKVKYNNDIGVLAY